MLLILQILLGIGAVVTFGRFLADYRVTKETDYPNSKFALAAGASTVINIFEALGIGNMAPLTLLIKYGKLIDDDKKLPGTLNVGVMLPVILEGFIYMTIIECDMLTLVLNVIGCVIGGLVGVRIVSKLPTKPIQAVVGFALIFAAAWMALGNMGIAPGGGELTGLTGGKLVLSVILQVIIGILGCMGVGCFALQTCMLYFLGMSPAVTFPIMMASAAFLQISNNNGFIGKPLYNRKVVLALNITGIIGILIGAFVVRSMELTGLKWLVVVIVAMGGIVLLIQAFGKSKTATAENDA